MHTPACAFSRRNRQLTLGARNRMPLPSPRSEAQGEGPFGNTRLLSPALSSIPWRRGSPRRSFCYTLLINSSPPGVGWIRSTIWRRNWKPPPLDSPAIPGNFLPAWRLMRQRQRQAIGSLTSSKLPLCKPSRGDWSRAERCLFPVSALPPSHFSQRCCARFSRAGPSSSSPTT